MITDISGQERAMQNRQNTLFDHLNRLESRHFFLGIEQINNPKGIQPSVKKINRQIKDWLDSLNPDQILQDPNHPSPTKKFIQGDFALTVSAIVKTPDMWAQSPSKLIGIYPGQSRWGDMKEMLMSALKKKAHKYGQMEVPFIIALNITSPWRLDKYTLMRALFGREEHHASKNIVQQEGLWVGVDGNPRYTRVSGILVGSIFPSNISKVTPTLYHNPYADNPCLHLPWRITQYRDIDGTYSKTLGETASEIFELPVDWPGHLFDN